jgi:3-isopropylmalate/(R)-2-methylmalate dehydratase large subunit
VLLEYLRSRTSAAFQPEHSDPDARYADVRVVDLGKLEPLVALPDSVVNNSRSAGDVAGTSIDQAFIGSCANGTLEDLRLAAAVLHGRQVSSKVRLIVTPGSQRVYLDAARDGTLARLVEAGALITSPTCGACGGGHMGVLGPEETCITASTRNFKGRMGDPSSRVYMGSPATVAASALTGVITDPRPYLA